MQYFLNKYNYNVSDESLIEDMRRTARKLGRIYIKFSEYGGYYHPRTIAERFGGWNKSLAKAGLIIMRNGRVDDDELMLNMKKVWDSLGRQPKWDEMVKPLSRYSSPTYARHFGSWRASLKEFIRFTKRNNAGTPSAGGGGLIKAKDKISKRRKEKYITKSMRFDVLKRDNFKCRLCGASPADDPKVRLQVDHIIPVSKGGETFFSNLQTLCRDCNLGKTNKLIAEQNPP
jgi:HNH endonuclease